MRTSGRRIVFLVGLQGVAWVLQAGTIIQQEEREPGTSKVKAQATISIDAGKLRMEQEKPGEGKSVMIFDQSKQVVWMIEPAKNSYMELTAAQVQQMGGQMQEAMKQMEAELAQMPPEQRKMVEQMMKQRMPAPKAEKEVTVREKGQGEKVGPYTCIHYEVLTGGQLTREVWTAPMDQTHLGGAEFKTFQALGEFMGKLAGQSPKGVWELSGMNQMQGFPVRVLEYDGPRATSEWVLVKAEQRSLEASLFTLPAGLKKSSMDGMSRE